MEKPRGTFLVTGSAGGIGRAIASQFTHSSYPFQGIFTVRDTSHAAAQPLHTILSNSPSSSIHALDLSSLPSIRAFAAEINARVSSGTLLPIRALVLNAGYMSSHGQRLTPAGYETNFQINYLANFLLVLLLLQSLDRQNGRILFITSWTHDPLDPKSRLLPLRKEMWRPVRELAIPAPDRGFSRTQAGLRRYAESKLCCMMFMHALQARLDAVPGLAKISVLSVDPGSVFSTGITRQQAWFMRGPYRVLSALTPCMQFVSPHGTLRTVERSAGDILHACFESEDPVLGKYPKAMYLDGRRLKVSSRESRDVGKQTLLWEGSLELAGLEEGETALGIGEGGVATR
ncbi:hypothetical protein MMC30_006601 [Trapelia coarctata]|nr:hypothetical protein [Trapelia coarctata]